jgi:dTMP kinase
MYGKIIVIEGLDASGKTTQFELLKTHLPDAEFVSFPDYALSSGKNVTEYLRGDYLEIDRQVNAYSAALRYALNRYDSAKTADGWLSCYHEGKIVIAARYVTSNAIYQAAKLPESDRRGFLDWLYDLEYRKLNLPRPDKVIYLDMPIAVSQRLLNQRYGEDDKRDLHERDVSYLSACESVAKQLAKDENWTVIPCVEGKNLRSREDMLKVIKENICETTLKN